MNVLDGIENPFRESIVRDAWSFGRVDVPEINRRAFDVCLEAFDQVARGLGSRSVLLHGSTGSGKTHLLSRLQNQLVTGAAGATQDAPTRCIFVSVRLQTSPQMLWQHLRQRLAEDLLREVQQVTQLQRLVAHYLAKGDAEHKSTAAWERALRVFTRLGDDHATIVDDLLDRVAEQAQLSFDLRKVLGHLIFRRHLLEARAWLRGDSLPEDALTRLGLATGGEYEPEDAAREVILGLCRLSETSLPMVLCFDQVEALQAHGHDRAAFFRLGGMLAALHDADDTLLILTCVQSGLLREFREAIREPDWRRLAGTETSLEPLWPEQAYLLVRRRLEARPELAEPRRARAAEPLWPLDPQQLAREFDQASTARRVLSHAERLFEQARAVKPAPAPSESDFLATELERRRQQALASLDPSATETTLRHGLVVGLDVALPGWRANAASGADDALDFEGPGRRVSAWILNQENMTSLASRLRRLVQAVDPGPRVLLRDPRLPIKKTARRSHEYLDTLVTQGVQLIQPDVEVLAALEALRTLLSDARAGDLANEGTPVQPDSVRAWLAGQLSELGVSSLYAQLLGMEPRPESVLENDLAAVLGERPIISLEALALAVSRSVEEIESTLRARPQRFGLLAGPPSVVFEYVPAQLEEERRS